jgi:hypothetical protein
MEKAHNAQRTAHRSKTTTDTVRIFSCAPFLLRAFSPARLFSCAGAANSAPAMKMIQLFRSWTPCHNHPFLNTF